MYCFWNYNAENPLCGFWIFCPIIEDVPFGKLAECETRRRNGFIVPLWALIQKTKKDAYPT